MTTSSTQNSILLQATPQVVYHAFTDPTALEFWLAPDDMYGKVHHFDLRVGGGYQMSLFYPSSEASIKGKTSEKEDRFTARFIVLSPPTRIVQVVTFDSDDPAFAGEMQMDVNIVLEEHATRVTIVFRDIPPGIRPEDNEAGTQSSLEKLARYVEQKSTTTP